MDRGLADRRQPLAGGCDADGGGQPGLVRQDGAALQSVRRADDRTVRGGDRRAIHPVRARGGAETRQCRHHRIPRCAGATQASRADEGARGVRERTVFLPASCNQPAHKTDDCDPSCNQSALSCSDLAPMWIHQLQSARVRPANVCDPDRGCLQVATLRRPSLLSLHRSTAYFLRGAA